MNRLFAHFLAFYIGIFACIIFFFNILVCFVLLNLIQSCSADAFKLEHFDEHESVFYFFYHKKSLYFKLVQL